MPEKITGDHLVKAIAPGVKIYAAVTTALAEEGRRRHDASPLAAAALGRTMTGALLLAGSLKNKEALTLQITGNGPLGKVVADATPEGAVRGYVTFPRVELPLKDTGKLDVGGGIGEGLITLTRFTGLKEPVRGSAELISGEIAEDITNYLYVSEQTPSSVGLGVLVGTDRKVAAAGGFLLQPMPDATEEILTQLEANLKTLPPVSSLINDGADARGIIATLLKGFDVEYLTTTTLSFRCQCSKRRVEDVLMSLGEADLASLAADGQAEVSCHFCGEKYQFNGEELAALLAVSRKLRSRTDGTPSETDGKE
ncbi:MAG: Hsp33 family molecular chaperone HslO [Selenomonadaceae bacterium]|nr:Hsp33 family molecular chaperone HslO [Selenomonadaceae bacterium]